MYKKAESVRLNVVYIITCMIHRKSSQQLVFKGKSVKDVCQPIVKKPRPYMGLRLFHLH